MYTYVGTNSKKLVKVKRGQLFIAYRENIGYVLCINLGIIGEYKEESYIIGPIKGYYTLKYNNTKKVKEYFVDLEYLRRNGQQLIDYAFHNRVEEHDIISTNIDLVKFEVDLSFLDTSLFKVWEQKNILAKLLSPHKDVIIANSMDKMAYVRTKDLVIGKFYCNYYRVNIFMYLGRTKDKGYRWLFLNDYIVKYIKDNNIVSLQQLYANNNIREYFEEVIDKTLNRRYELDAEDVSEAYRYCYKLGGLKV